MQIITNKSQKELKEHGSFQFPVLVSRECLSGYETGGEYFGASVGRCCNRIREGAFTLNGVSYQLAVNDGTNHLHGGNRSFSRRLWNASCAENRVVFQLESPNGEEQYPGNMQVTATYTWDDTNTLTIAYDAICDQDTLCNLTNHTYFQLDGEGSGSIEKQQLLVRANAYLPTDQTSIPTGEIVPVAETPFDFTAYRSIGEALEGKHEQLTYASGIDHSYVVDSHAPFQAAAYSAESGIGLTCTTTQPAVHVYTGNFVHVPESLGKNGHRYTARSGFCLETQNYPDAIHHPNFPTPILPANTPYRQVTTFHFSLGREEA